MVCRAACLGAIVALGTTSAYAQDNADAAVSLDEIVVTASGFQQTVREAPASITVISREELEKGSFRNLTDALREAQGVAVTGVANEKDIFIRGLPGAYTLILVDGKRQSTRNARPNGSSGFEQGFVPPLDAIERIEIVRGPMSSLYGSDAMGGVINIITRKVGTEWGGSATIEGTLQQHEHFGNAGQGTFYLNGPVVQDRVGLQAWGRGYLRGEDDFVDGTSGAEEGNVGGRLTFTPNENHDFLIEGNAARQRRLSEVFSTLADGDSDDYADHDRFNWSATHIGRWDWTTSELSFSQELGRRTNHARGPGNVGPYIENERSPEILNSVADAKFTTPFEAFGGHTLVTGGQFFRAELTDRGHLPQDQTMSVDQWAAFAEDEWRLTDSFALTGGLRLDYHESYGEHFSPRLYGVWNATDALTVKGGVSTGFRAPELRQIATGYYTATQQGAGYIAANPALEPETSINYEIGALWDAGSGVSLGATAFYTEFEDKIANMNTNTLVNADTGDIIDPLGGAACNRAALGAYPGYRCLWQNFNIDDAVIQGLELTASWQATDTLSFRANYTYTDSEQRTGDFAGFPLARTPEHAGSLRADWVTPIEGLATWGLVTYHGSQINAGARIGSNGSEVEINGAIGRKYDAYTLVDAGLSYALNETMTVSAAVYNIFDKSVGSTDYNTTQEGRRFWMSLKAQF